MDAITPAYYGGEGGTLHDVARCNTPQSLPNETYIHILH